MNIENTKICNDYLKEVKLDMVESVKNFGRNQNNDSLIDSLDKIYDKINEVSKVLELQVKRDNF